MIFLSTFCRAQPLLKLSVKPAFHMGVESSLARAHRAVRGSQEQIYGFCISIHLSWHFVLRSLAVKKTSTLEAGCWKMGRSNFSNRFKVLLEAEIWSVAVRCIFKDLFQTVICSSSVFISSLSRLEVCKAIGK